MDTGISMKGDNPDQHVSRTQHPNYFLIKGSVLLTRLSLLGFVCVCVCVWSIFFFFLDFSTFIKKISIILTQFITTTHSSELSQQDQILHLVYTRNWSLR